MIKDCIWSHVLTTTWASIGEPLLNNMHRSVSSELFYNVYGIIRIDDVSVYVETFFNTHEYF